jgi:murein DD-endopeptidase MepM/ murein hydrolase activator NlpD
LAVATLRTPRTGGVTRHTSSAARVLRQARPRVADPSADAGPQPISKVQHSQGEAFVLAATSALERSVRLTTALVHGLRQSPAVPRLGPHALVLALVATAVTVGGFSRPESGLDVPVSTEAGNLSTNARLLLGPRVGEVQVRDALVRPALSATTLTPPAPRMDVISYVVRAGDSAWDIGARFNVGAWSVLWSNGLDEDSVIKPGQELRIPPVRGVVHTVAEGDTLDSIAQKFNVDPAAIVDFNGLRPGEALTPDKVLVIPGGALPVITRPAPPPPPPVIQAPRPPIPQVRPPVPQAPPQARPAQPPQEKVEPPPPPRPAPTGRLSWPTRGVITTYFTGWHQGIDIAAPLGTPIAAADGGTVTFVGWDNTGYGNRLVINHGNGYSTTYNHLSAFLVRSGQTVSKGQQIARMGSTGRSTGSHLHFEILRNGVFVNPLGVLS